MEYKRAVLLKILSIFSQPEAKGSQIVSTMGQRNFTSWSVVAWDGGHGENALQLDPCPYLHPVKKEKNKQTNKQKKTKSVIFSKFWDFCPLKASTKMFLVPPLFIIFIQPFNFKILTNTGSGRILCHQHLSGQVSASHFYLHL